MNKNTLRSLGTGLLIAAILLAAFTIFVQGNTPVEGIDIPSILNQGKESLAQYEAEISSLQADKESLEETRNTLNESITAHRDNESNLKAEIEALQTEVTSLTRRSNESADESEESSEVEENGNENEDDNFVINEGESSADIALRLEEAGFVDSAIAFEALINDWGLETVIQAGNYELNDQMTYDDIASIITNGAYYAY